MVVWSRYALYLSENKMAVQHQCGTKSMPVLSRRLGKMWSELTAKEKNVSHSSIYPLCFTMHVILHRFSTAKQSQIE